MKQFEIVFVNKGKKYRTKISAKDEIEALSLAKDDIDGTIIELSKSSQSWNIDFKNIIPNMQNHTKELIFVCTQISTMTNAGITLMDSLVQIEASLQNRTLKKCFGDIINEVNSGSEFSEAIKRRNAILGSEFTIMAGLGEHTGDMSIAMRQLSLILIRKESINRRLIHAITYPTLTLFASIMAFFIIISIVVPKFQAIFEKFHLKLPLFTQLLLGFAGFCKDYGIILLLALCIAFMTVYYFYRQNENFKLKIDSLLLKIPILGSVIQLGVAGRFALILYSLANTGVPIIKSLEIARDGIKNISLRTDISVVIESIKTGSDLSSAFKYSTIYDALCLGLISSGEQSGSIVEMFEKIYEYYEQKFETKVQFLTTILEPLMVMMVGIVVMILAIGIFVPLWDMTAMARR